MSTESVIADVIPIIVGIILLIATFALLKGIDSVFVICGVLSVILFAFVVIAGPHISETTTKESDYYQIGYSAYPNDTVYNKISAVPIRELPTELKEYKVGYEQAMVDDLDNLGTTSSVSNRKINDSIEKITHSG